MPSPQPVMAAADLGFDQPVPQDGYRWWYLDAFSDDGAAGLTVILFVGSVFSPYYASARRRGRGTPENYSSINVILYGPKRKYWTLTERGKMALSRAPKRFRVGPSEAVFADGTLTLSVKERCTPLPFAVEGTITVTWPTLSDQCYALDAEGHHRWWPAAPSASVAVDFSHPELSWRGQGYLDSNAGTVPLEQTFQGWQWLRSEGAGPAEDKSEPATGHILYQTQPRQGAPTRLALAYDGSATLRHRDVVMSDDALPATRIWRIDRPLPAGAEKGSVLATFEDTPFYSRSKVQVDIDGKTETAMHESLDLDRFSRRWVQTLLPFRMPRRARW